MPKRSPKAGNGQREVVEVPEPRSQGVDEHGAFAFASLLRYAGGAAPAGARVSGPARTASTTWRPRTGTPAEGQRTR